MTLEEAREEHKKFFRGRSRIQKTVFTERYNEGVDLHTLIHTPAMFTVRERNNQNMNKNTRKMKNALAAIGIL